MSATEAIRVYRQDLTQECWRSALGLAEAVDRSRLPAPMVELLSNRDDSDEEESDDEDDDVQLILSWHGEEKVAVFVDSDGELGVLQPLRFPGKSTYFEVERLEQGIAHVLEALSLLFLGPMSP